mgnify:CR=1 FL=1
MKVRRILLMPFAAALLTGAAAEEPSESPIRFNQIGFEPGAQKRFVVEARRTFRWSLRDAAGDVVAQGEATPQPDPESGEDVAAITIDTPLPAGRYAFVAGDSESRSVTVAAHPFRGLARDALGFFYQQRAGIPIERRYVQRADLARPAGHRNEVATCFSGRDQKGLVWPGCDREIDISGGWYDAGDRGKYVVNAGVSVWMLLDAYARSAAAGATPLTGDGIAAMPEAGNGIPDILDEARYELEWLLKMQLPDHSRVAVTDIAGNKVRMIDGSGLAYHKLADAHWAPMPIRVEDDHRPRYLYPPSTAATLNLAAVAAQAARIWRPIDPAFADRCLAAARRAFAAALAHPALFADDRFDGSGAYGDTDVSDEFFWAAAELAATTEERRYIDYVAASPFPDRKAAGGISWGSTAPLGTITLATQDDRLPETLVAAQRRAVLAAADRLVADDAAQGYRFPAVPGPTQWGSNGALLSNAVLLGTAYDLSGDGRYRRAVIDALDYVLGRNPLDRSYVTGYGARAMRNPHHRFWAHQLDPSFPLPPPGVVSGGPNSSAMVDPVAQRMRGSCAALTCWADDARAYALNEVAINWNAPLLWTAVFADATAGGAGSAERPH